jgi:phosphoribosyl 1,2-cyclic phosphodiesterase
MQLEIIGCNSLGNCYVLIGQKTNIMIEAGISKKQVIKQIGGQALKKIDFGLISHHHQDHCRYAKDFRFPFFTSKIATEHIKGNQQILRNFKLYEKGEWEFKAFPVIHNVANNGFWIRNRESDETYVFMTDFVGGEYHFKGINYYIVEANYSETLLKYNVDNDIIDMHTWRSIT